MNKNVWVGLGVLGVFLVLSGSIFTLQGLGLLAGSQMTGQTQWAIIGPLIAIIGAILVVGAVRSRRGPR